MSQYSEEDTNSLSSASLSSVSLQNEVNPVTQDTKPSGKNQAFSKYEQRTPVLIAAQKSAGEGRDFQQERSRTSIDSENYQPDDYLGDTDIEKNGDAGMPKPGLQKTSTRASLMRKITKIELNESQIVPNDARRGILCRFELIPEYKDARELPRKLRGFFTFIIAYIAMIGPMGTSILFPATDNAVNDLKTTVSVFNVAVGIYLVTLGVIPMWWSNFSERWGRRSIYIVSFILYVGFTIGCALSRNVVQLIIFRIFSGGCAASVQAVGAGTVTDMYTITERGTAMGVFYLGVLAGPLLAPIVGGAITSNPSLGWRATQWFLVILAVCGIVMVVLFLPETLRRQESREAIRKLLRKRRDQVTPKSALDVESKADIEGKTKNKGSRPETRSSAKPLRRLNTRRSSFSTISKVDLEDPEQEDTHLDRIISRLSVQASAIAKDEDEDEDESLQNDRLQTSDAAAPLTRVRTAGTFKPKKNKEQKLEKQMTTLQEVQKGGFWKKAGYYFKIYGWGPLKAFAFLRYPPVALSIAYSAPCFAALYVLNMSLTYCYSRSPYNFGPMLVGLVYIPNSVTYFIASVWGGKFNDYLLKRKIKKYGVVAPEARFGINVFTAAVLLPLSLLISGWCLDKHEHWVTPLIGTALFGFAQMIVIGITITYLSDCLPGRGATGVAINNFIRQLMAAGVTFATAPLIKAIGVGPLFSICAGITAILMVILVIIVKRGDHWRETYDLEKLYDIVDS